MGEVTKDDITKSLFMGSRDILNRNKIDDDYWAKRLKKLSKAKKTDTFKASDKMFDDGNLISQTERVIYSDPMDDNDIQLKATIQIGNHLGHVVAERREIGGMGGGPLTIQIVKFGGVIEADNREPAINGDPQTLPIADKNGDNM